MTEHDTLDFSETLEVLDELREMIAGLQDERVNIEVSSKKVSSQKAEVNRKLLYGAHLADLVRVSVLNEYHRFKGANPPLIVAAD